MEKETILGVQVCVTDYPQIKAAIKEDLEAQRKAFLVAINPEKILKARKDEALKNLLNNATYQIADGVGVVYASKLRGGKIRSRVTGIDSMKMLCELSDENGYRIFMYGAKEEILQKAKEKLIETYPNIQIAGTMNGYQKDKQAVVDAINESNADIVLVAMGSPRQENWIVENMNTVCAKVFQGVGGSFDVVSGTIPRAPQWMQKCGLEWLFRLLREPKRIGRQIHLVSFLFLALFSRH